MIRLLLCLVLSGCASSDIERAQNQAAWAAMHPQFAAREQVRDRNLEAALETP